MKFSFSVICVCVGVDGRLRSSYSPNNALPPSVVAPGWPLPLLSPQMAPAVAIPGDRRDAYVLVDEFTLTDDVAFTNYFQKLADIGVSHIMNGFMMPKDLQSDTSADLWDGANMWQRLSPMRRNATLEYIHSKGSSLLLIAGGGSYDVRTYLEMDPKMWGARVCSYAATLGYDGVLFELEGWAPSGPLGGEIFFNWAIAASRECKEHIGFLAHSPQSPMLLWGYTALFPYIDKMLVQYFNQPPAKYEEYTQIFEVDIDFRAAYKSVVANFPEAQSKLVVGKYVQEKYATVGLMTPDVLGAALDKAETELGYKNGFMIWKAPSSAAEPEEWEEFQSFFPALARYSPPEQLNTTTTTTMSTTTTTTTRPSTSEPTIATVPSTTQVATVPSTTQDSLNSEIVEVCQGLVGNANPSWDEDCRRKCAFYASSVGQSWCPSVTTGEDLAECIKTMSPYC